MSQWITGTLSRRLLSSNADSQHFCLKIRSSHPDSQQHPHWLAPKGGEVGGGRGESAGVLIAPSLSSRAPFLRWLFWMRMSGCIANVSLQKSQRWNVMLVTDARTHSYMHTHTHTHTHKYAVTQSGQSCRQWVLGSPASNGVVFDWWGRVKVFGSGEDGAKSAVRLQTDHIQNIFSEDAGGKVNRRSRDNVRDKECSQVNRWDKKRRRGEGDYNENLTSVARQTAHGV